MTDSPDRYELLDRLLERPTGERTRVARGLKVPLEDHGRIWDRVADGETLQSIANEYGVSRERIRQIAKGAINHRRRLHRP